MWLHSKNLIRRLAVFASKVTNVDTAYYSWKKLNKPWEHYFLKREHLKSHWKRIKPIWIQMRRENCSYQLRSQPRRSTSTVKWIYNPNSLIKFRVSLRCLVHLIRSTKFLDRQCVWRSPKMSGGMLKTNYESNACLLLETDLRWLLWRLGLLLRALISGLWPVMTLARYIFPRSALQSFDARRGRAKKLGNFLLLC